MAQNLTKSERFALNCQQICQQRYFVLRNSIVLCRYSLTTR